MSNIEQQDIDQQQASELQMAEVNYHLANAQNELTAALKLMPAGERAQLCLCAAGVVTNIRKSL